MHSLAQQQYVAWYISNDCDTKTSVRERMPESPHYRLCIAVAHKPLIGHLLELLAALEALALAALSEVLRCPRSGQRQQLPFGLLAERPHCFVSPVLQCSKCHIQPHFRQLCVLTVVPSCVCLCMMCMVLP